MFYNDSLFQSKTIGEVWRVAYNQQNRESGPCVPKICEELNRWVGSEHILARRRMSLRTSAVLINGAARIYKQEMEQLYRDSSKSYSERSTPELMMRQSECPTTDSITSLITDRKRRKSSLQMPQIHLCVSSCSDSTSLKQTAANTDFESSETEQTNSEDDDDPSEHKTGSEKTPEVQSSGTSDSTKSDEGSNSSGLDFTWLQGSHSNVNSDVSVETGSNGSNPSIILRSSAKLTPGTNRRQVNESTDDAGTPQKKDQGSQTYFHLRSNSSGRTRDGSDNNLPFGCLIIYDSFNSRTPSKIVLSSLKSNVNDLMCNLY